MEGVNSSAAPGVARNYRVTSVKKPFCGLEPWNRAAVPLAQVQKKGQQLQGEGEGVDPGTKVSKVWGRRLRLTVSPILGAREYAIVMRFVPMGASSSAGRRVSSKIF